MQVGDLVERAWPGDPGRVGLLIEQLPKGEIETKHFSKYQKKLRTHEKIVTSLVESYYLTTRNETLLKFWPSFDENGLFRRKFDDHVETHFVAQQDLLSVLYGDIVIALCVRELCLL